MPGSNPVIPQAGASNTGFGKGAWEFWRRSGVRRQNFTRDEADVPTIDMPLGVYHASGGLVIDPVDGPYTGLQVTIGTSRTHTLTNFWMALMSLQGNVMLVKTEDKSGSAFAALTPQQFRFVNAAGAVTPFTAPSFQAVFAIVVMAGTTPPYLAGKQGTGSVYSGTPVVSGTAGTGLTNRASAVADGAAVPSLTNDFRLPYVELY
jgi:hypothetical protein